MVPPGGAFRCGRVFVVEGTRRGSVHQQNNVKSLAASLTYFLRPARYNRAF